MKVDKLLDSEEFTDKNSPEYKKYIRLKAADKENVEALDLQNKYFQKITDKDTLIKEAMAHEKTLNTIQETRVPEKPAPKPAPVSVNQVEDEGPAPIEVPTKEEIDNAKAEVELAEEELKETKELEKLAETEEEKAKAEFARKLAEKKAAEAKVKADLLALQPLPEVEEDTMFNDSDWDSATPLTLDTVFKTHTAGTDRDNQATQHNPFHKFLDDKVNPENNEYALLPVALDSELGNKIKAKEMKFYNSIAGTYVDKKTGKTYSPFLMKGHELLYLMTKQVKGMTHAVRENGETLPLNDVLFGDNVPQDLVYSKSSAPHPQGKDESIEDTHKRWIEWVKGVKSDTKDIKQEFSTKSVTEEEIIEIVGTYLKSLNKMYDESINMTEDNYLDLVKPITGITPGIQIKSQSKLESIGDEYTFKIATLSKNQQVGAGQTLQKGRVYAFKDGKYFHVRYRDYSDQELDKITELVTKLATTGELTGEEKNYLTHVINWYDDYTVSGGQQNSIGIIDGSIVFAPRKVGMRKIVRLENFREELKKLKHFVSKDVKSTDLFTDLATGTTYQNGYSEYLKDRNVLTMYMPLNESDPIQKNRQAIFSFDYEANKYTYDTSKDQEQESGTTVVSNYEDYDYPTNVPTETIKIVKKGLRNTDWSVTPPGLAMAKIGDFEFDIMYHDNQQITIEGVYDATPLPEDEVKNDIIENNTTSTSTDTPPATIYTPEEIAAFEAEDAEPYRLNPLYKYDDIENVPEFSDWLSKVLPQFLITTESKPIDGIAQGQLVQNVIRLWEGAEKGTGFHEAFEAVWNNILTPEQQKDLLVEFRERKGSFKYAFSGEMLEYDKATDLQAKETMAEEFIDFMRNTTVKPNPKANTFFFRLKKALIDLINQIKAFFGSTTQAKATINNIYQNIADASYFNHNINSFYPYAENRLIQRFKTPEVAFSHMQDALDIIHDKFVEEILEKDDNVNIYNLLDNADEAENSLAEYIMNRIDPILDAFEMEMGAVSKLPENLPAPGKPSFRASNTLFAPAKTGLILKEGLKDELKNLYVEQFLKRSKLKDFVDFQAYDEIETSSKEGRVSEDEINPTSNVNTVIRFLLGTLYHTNENGKSFIRR